MSEHRAHPPFLRYFGSGAIVVLAAALLTHTMENSWIFRHMENTNLDTWFLAKTIVPSHDVFVVLITDDDYRDLFQSTSPLRPDVVKQIVGAIAASGPKVLGVDLDTSEWDPAATASLPTNVPIVWAREASDDGSTLQKVLGGDGAGICFGLPAFVPDEDGVIRRYPAEGAFAQQVASGCREPSAKAAPPSGEEGKLINFRGDSRAFDHLSSSALLMLSKTPDWLTANPLKNKIVLLGGSFRAARDKFYTAVGRLDGVDILAHTVQSELPGGAVRSPSGTFFFVLDVALGLALVAGTWMLPRVWALPTVFIGLPAVAFLASWGAFQSLGYFASFVPVLGGVLIHELIEHAREHRHLLHENAKMRRELEMIRIADSRSAN
jgi:CHASE2 domain-containing sensor protein